MYQVVNTAGDTVPVPQLLFAKLSAPGADDARFRVALYALTQPQTDACQVAQALHLRQRDVERALEFWEGAGLLEKAQPPQHDITPLARRRFTTAETTSAAQKDFILAGLLGELQHIFGGVISQADCNIIGTLYAEDHMPADLILLACSYCATQGKASVRYIEKLLLNWRKDGIDTCTKADAYLLTLEQRAQNENVVAALMSMPQDCFTLAERRRIAIWFEEYGYEKGMIEAARLVAGDKENNIAYLHGILRKWHGKGYTTPRDVQQSSENRNIRVQGSTGVAPEDDLLMNTSTYVPLYGQGETT